MASTPLRRQTGFILPPLTPLGYTPQKTELDSPSLSHLRKKFGATRQKIIDFSEQIEEDSQVI
jgi:hypothetical protein